MLIFRKSLRNRPGCLVGERTPVWPALLGADCSLLALAARAPIVEFSNLDLDEYFIVADPAEQALVDTGARRGHAGAAGNVQREAHAGLK